MERLELPPELLALISGGESVNVEFKKSRDGITKDVYDTVCSFSNRDGGHIFLGVKDGKGIILGVNASALPKMKKEFSDCINNPNKVNPPLYLTLEEYEYDGKVILHTYVPSGTTVYRHAGRIYDRSHESDIDITDNAALVYRLYARKQDSFFVNKVIPGIELRDLRSDLIERTREMTREGHPWRGMADEEMLRSAKLILRDRTTSEEGLTLAAVLLLGPDSLIYSVLPQHKTDALLRVHDTDRYDDRDIVETNLIESYDRLMGFGKRHLNDLFVLDGDRRVSARDAILREVIANLLCHRDFSSRFIASMTIEGDRLLTRNGNVAHGLGSLKLDAFSPYAKNPPIADFFREIGWADELGSGMRNTFKYTGLYSGGTPSFEEGDTFVTTVPLTRSATGVRVGPHSEELSHSRIATPLDAVGLSEILEFCSEPRSRRELQDFCGYKSAAHFRKRILKPLLEGGQLEPTIPETPNSPLQRYARTRA